LQQPARSNLAACHDGLSFFARTVFRCLTVGNGGSSAPGKHTGGAKWCRLTMIAVVHVRSNDGEFDIRAVTAPLVIHLALALGEVRSNDDVTRWHLQTAMDWSALRDHGVPAAIHVADRRSGENEEAVNALLDMVMGHYAIDKKRVAVTGCSMGGTGSWHLAEKFPERFSAAIPIASRPPASAAGTTMRLRELD
jgi:pimeloyl-ACP methyl ester carboxylesterase